VSLRFTTCAQTAAGRAGCTEADAASPRGAALPSSPQGSFSCDVARAHDWDGRVNPLRVVGPGEYVNALVKTLSLERAAILDDPGALLRVKEPPIEMVWGYVLAVTHCIERLEIRRSRWRLFLLDQDLDEPYAYKRMIANQTFGDRIAFMRKLFDDFDAWRAAQESK
jgi:hypothetical protein